jgi:hypothetical protein
MGGSVHGINWDIQGVVGCVCTVLLPSGTTQCECPQHRAKVCTQRTTGCYTSIAVLGHLGVAVEVERGAGWEVVGAAA